jgi:hypothetical protein
MPVVAAARPTPVKAAQEDRVSAVLAALIQEWPERDRREQEAAAVVES